MTLPPAMFAALLVLWGQTATPSTPPPTAEATDDTSSVAPAPDTPEGRAVELFEESRQLYRDRKYEASITRLKAAHKLVQSPSLLYNIAKCYERLSDYPNAIVFYQRYLNDAVGASDTEVVRETIKHFKAKLKKSAAPKSPEERAKVLARKGREFYQVGRYADAIAQLERAHVIVPNSAFIYNIAKCYEKMGEYDDAVVFYQRYLGMEPNASDRQDVISLIASLEARMRQTLSELTVRSEPLGADVYIDDMSKMHGQTPVELRLEPGTHKLVLVKNGFESVEIDFDMPEDRPRDFMYQLQKVKNIGGLTLDCNVNGAQIFVDGKILALTPYTTTKLLEQGVHQVTVQRDGYFMYQANAEIRKGQTTHVRANLPERGELTGWMTTLGTWVIGTSVVVGGVTSVVSYWLGGYTVAGTPPNETLWTVQQVGMYGGLVGIFLGAGVIGLDFLIQPTDIHEEVGPSGFLPGELEALEVDDEVPTTTETSNSAEIVTQEGGA